MRIRKASVTIVSQNLRGLKSDARLDDFFCYVLLMGIIAACIQERCRFDVESLQNRQCMLLLADRGALAQAGKRGSQGVGITLSPDGVEAWKASGCELHNNLGARVIAVRLRLRDRAN